MDDFILSKIKKVFRQRYPECDDKEIDSMLNDTFAIQTTPKKKSFSNVRMLSDFPGVVVDKPDDLMKIKGIGEKIQTTLNSLGFYTFEQIANLTDEEIDYINQHLSFKSRIESENWIGQAKELQ